MTTPKKFYAVKAVAGTKSALAFKHKDGKLYFCLTKGVKGIFLPPPPPVLFLTKSEAQKAIDKNGSKTSKKTVRKLKRMFETVIKADYAEPVKVSVSLN